jgi:hypothetical protein
LTRNEIYAGTAEAAEIGVPGIQEPEGTTDYTFTRARLGISSYLLFNYEMATRGCGQLL